MDIKVMIATIQSYIHHRTGKEVDINIQQFNNPMNIVKLQQAYDCAINWFRSNNGSIQQI